MVNIKPHIIIQARMGSTRLPSKVMMPINGKPMIGYQLERLLVSGLPVIIATSDAPSNDALVAYVKSLGVEVFRGSEENVLERFYKAAKQSKATDVIRITGDNPLIDANFIQSQLINFYPKTRRYYLSEGSNRKLPMGMSFEMFSFQLLKEAYLNAKLDSEREHVTPYMHQNRPGDIEIREFNTQLNLPEARLTVDTREDFNLVEKLITDYNCHLKKTEEIIEILKTDRSLMEINCNVIQKKWN